MTITVILFLFSDLFLNPFCVEVPVIRASVQFPTSCWNIDGALIRIVKLQAAIQLRRILAQNKDRFQSGTALECAEPDLFYPFRNGNRREGMATVKSSRFDFR